MTILAEAFEKILKATEAKLRTQGFRRTGYVFRNVGDDNCIVIEFQRSDKSSSESLIFTVNLGVICGRLLSSGVSDLKKARVIDAHIRLRIGALLPERCDKWWEINAATDYDHISEEVSELISNSAVPYLMPFLDIDAVIQLWRSGQSPGLTNVQRLRFLSKVTDRDDC